MTVICNQKSDQCPAECLHATPHHRVYDDRMGIGAEQWRGWCNEGPAYCGYFGLDNAVLCKCVEVEQEAGE